MKKTKEIVLYDDTENYKKFDETRDFLFEVYADENGWACKENIPDETVYKEIDFQNTETWRDLKDALENSFKTRYYLMMELAEDGTAISTAEHSSLATEIFNL